MVESILHLSQPEHVIGSLCHYDCINFQEELIIIIVWRIGKQHKDFVIDMSYCGRGLQVSEMLAQHIGWCAC